MNESMRAMLVVLTLALATFALIRPMSLKYMTAENYDRRRNVWVLLTAIAFLSPSFWLYACVAFPVMYWAGRKDDNPVAIYLMLLHVIPPWGFPLPAVFINELFDLSNYRLLEFAIIIPSALHLLNRKNIKTTKLEKYGDGFLIAFMVMQLVSLMPYENITNTIRRAFVYVVDISTVFYVISRSSKDKSRLIESLAVFLISCALLVPIAAFESAKYWLLYTGLADVWNVPVGTYLMRGDSLRAQASMGHSLVLGYWLAMGFIIWIYFAIEFKSKIKMAMGSIYIWLGLVAALSRAPWVTAILGYFAFQALRPKGFKYAIKSILWAIPVMGLVLMLPMGQKIIDVLPFVGTVDTGSVEYRQQLAEKSWQIILNNPFFGDPFFMDYLEDMRQGEGIIDLVNVYASIAMQYGFFGLLLFIGPSLVALCSAFRNMRNIASGGESYSMLGACLLACIVATAFFMVTGSLGTGLERMYYILVAMGIGFAGISIKPLEHSMNAK